MKIYLGSDHAGYDLKLVLADFLKDRGYSPEDLGPHVRDLTDDYPDFVAPVAQAVAADPLSWGIVIGGNGQGEAVVANRFHGVRAAVLYSFNERMIRTAREHDNANVLSLGARFIADEEAKAAVLLWLETPFSNDARHLRRLAKLDALK